VTRISGGWATQPPARKARRRQTETNRGRLAKRSCGRGKSIAWQDRPSFKAKAERGEYHISPSYDTLSGIAGYVVEHFATARYLESAGTAEQAKAIAQRDYESGK
jgi:hypothetical protein